MRCTLALMPLLVLVGCGSATSPSAARAAEEASVAEARGAHAETVNAKQPRDALSPEATVQHMLELAEAGEWGTYVDDFYGEAHKFRGASDRQKLIEMLSRKGPGIVQALRQVSTVEPVISSDGSQAEFPLGDGNRFTLYWEGSGRWMFHL